MKIPLVKPQFDPKKIAKAVQKISESGILTKGPYLAKFESQLKGYLKVKYVFATTSCTTALHLALVAAKIGPGDEVLVSDFSFPATGNVVVQVGATPVFVDINLEGFVINIDDFQKKITPKTKAILVVHAFGYPADMEKILKIAKKHHLVVIEDAACALGSELGRQRKLGSLGDFGCFSFHPRKNITTGEGGAVVTNNPKYAQKIEVLRNHGGVQENHKWKFVDNGYNYRLSELQAALGVEQMEKIDKICQKRQKISQKYNQKLADIPGLILPQKCEYGQENYQSYVVILPKNIHRQKLQDFLAKKGIETVLGTYAMHAQPSFAKFGYKPGDLLNSYLAYEHTLTLPLYGQMTENEVEYVAESLKKIIHNA